MNAGLQHGQPLEQLPPEEIVSIYSILVVMEKLISLFRSNCPSKVSISFSYLNSKYLFKSSYLTFTY